MSKTTYDVKWKMEWPSENIPVEQVYGILFSDDGKILILDDQGRFNLPGGHPENNETWIETLKRECMEEAQVEIVNPMYLGCVSVIEKNENGTRLFSQLRFIANIGKLLPSCADPVTGKIYRRDYVNPSKAAELLNWGEHGIQQLEDAEKLWELVSKYK
ncbi:NUDIX hydrolase [Acinetobacter sp. AOR15_HL]|uniref:NUDIX hydrolase n=1 Tax=unclassified Acinetobacter TaxID=196816 RepID=UPI0022EAF263|nr:MULTISPECIES: NUDIX hydrolase [unclassified Acinetobacter]MDA3556162.1 NUDIX hydrolase [Acinetobacter sp. AOR15_HL]MDA3571619.1 NUDIX hydrolase [Acinetobacter sp. AOR14_HL]